MEPPKRKREDEGFQPSAGFAGPRPGFYFGRGESGVGYYRDQPSGGARVHVSRAVRPAADGAALLAAAEAEAGEAEELDERFVRRACAALERRLVENVEARAKHAGAPARWAESEVELHAELKRLGALAAAPELLPHLVRAGAPAALLQLLSHENADVAAECAQLLAELVEGDAAAESADAAAGAQELAGALLAGGLLPALLAQLARFDERVAEERAAVHSLLRVLEGAAELGGAARAALLAHEPLLPALLARVRGRKGAPADENRAYAAEVVAVLLSGGGGEADAARARLGEAGGVDDLLRAISYFRAKPAAAEADAEAELLEHCFDALCCALMLPANRARFVAGEGVELMLLVVRAKGCAKTAALKALDFALTRCPPAAQRLVDARGLGAVFAAFSGRSAAACRRLRGAEAAAEEEQRAVSIVAQLFAALPLGDGRRERLAAKFVEGGFEKIDRLAELWFAHAARLRAAELQLPPAEEEEGEEAEEAEAERYAARMEAGLFTLQQLAAALAGLWAHGHSGANARALAALRLGGGQLSDVRTVLREAAAAIGDGGEAVEAEVAEERARMAALADLLVAEGEEADAEEEEEGDAGEEAEEGEEPAEPPGRDDRREGLVGRREGLVDEDED